MKLEIRTYSVKELAEWFNIKPNTFSKSKQSYLNKLSFYASYHLNESKKIVIDEIYEEVYTKISIMDQRIKNIDRDGGIEGYLPENGYFTLTDMAFIYMEKHPEETKLKPVIRAFSLVAKRDFGRYPKGQGPKGIRFTCWAKINSNNTYTPLDARERKIAAEIYDKYFSKEAKSAEIQGYIDGELNAVEVAEKDKARYLKFLSEAAELIGSPIKTVSRFEPSAFSKEVKES